MHGPTTIFAPKQYAAWRGGRIDRLPRNPGSNVPHDSLWECVGTSDDNASSKRSQSSRRLLGASLGRARSRLSVCWPRNARITGVHPTPASATAAFGAVSCSTLAVWLLFFQLTADGVACDI